MSSEGTKITPMMRQYLDIKEGLPEGTLLLFRMGDFYEMFFDDAVLGSEIMGITLTKRANIPMAGVPHHSMQNYLQKILESGTKVAMAEQVEDPKEAKGLVRREVSKIITPGTIVEDNILQAGQSNFIVSVNIGKKNIGIACLDLSTGNFRITEVADMDAMEIELNRLKPAECLLSETINQQWLERPPELPVNTVLTSVDDWNFDYEYCYDLLCKQFEVKTLEGFGCDQLKNAIVAAGVVLNYGKSNLRKNAKHIKNLTVYNNVDYMIIDRISQKNLELVEPLFRESKDATLVTVLNNTVTPMGSRLLREWILRPLMNKKEILRRQDAVEVFVQDNLLCSEFKEAVGGIKDIERIITRLNIGNANARDLLALLQAIDCIPSVRAILNCADSALLQELMLSICELPELSTRISEAIVDEPPLTIKEGGIFKDGFNPDLDVFKKGATQGKQWLLELEMREKERTGFKGLKIKYNRVFGYYIEFTKSNLHYVPEDYIRKQTLTNAERFITPELKEIESNVLGAEDKAKALEYELFQKLREEVTTFTAQIQETAKAIAAVDVIASLAQVAVNNSYVRPKIIEQHTVDIVDGRHPVVDSMLDSGEFVPNDTYMESEESHLHIITGPNMAGKSTYIRQIAMLTLMTQMGSFIPCKQASIGIMDRIFTRIGAADDISRGQSTFMVEMVETANILNNVTEKSLVILDEIGRGTSTYDGLSLAWAISEFLDETKALTLFATHYHELTDLAQNLKGVENFNVAVREWDEKIIFLHKIQKGGTDKSYGIYVARLAGVPKSIIERSKTVLGNLESAAVSNTGESAIRKKKTKKNDKENPQPSLFDWSEEMS